MGYYHDYYAGYKRDGKIYPLGPYNSAGKLQPIISRSSSFASDLHEIFDNCEVPYEEASDALLKEFETTDFHGNKIVGVKAIPLSGMPTGPFIQKGYFLIKDIASYEETGDSYDLFYERLSPTVYAAKLLNELKLGKPEQKYDCEGEPLPNYSAGDYSYYAFEDTGTREWESAVICLTARMLMSYPEFQNEDEIYILETEG